MIVASICTAVLRSIICLIRTAETLPSFVFLLHHHITIYLLYLISDGHLVYKHLLLEKDAVT